MKKVIAILGIIFLVQPGYGSNLDEYFRQLCQTHIIPGFSIVVVKGDKVIYQGGFGYEYVNGKKIVTDNTQMAVGSLGKSFTALAMMQLAEEGKVNLDDPVIAYIPWFRTANKELSDKITIRMLLDNTSGLRAPLVRNKLISEKATEALVRSMESVYLTIEPGTRYEYSNDGFALAGLIISKISGMPYEKYLEEKVFAPLGMKNTTSSDEELKGKDVLHGHYFGIDRAIPATEEDPTIREYVAAGSELRSSASEMGNYLRMLVNDGVFQGKQIISKKSLDEMWTPYSSFPGISKKDGGEDLLFSYGLGWFLTEIEGKKYIFHGGNRRTMSSMTFLYPKEKTGAMLIANIDLTFINRYQYPNLVNILNNVIRLSLGESISDFAVPTVPDETLNDFHLAEGHLDKYVGNYLLSEGEDWVYQGSQLSIYEHENKLEGKITKGDQTIEAFGIDFLTPRTAVSRNIAMPNEMVFKFLNADEVSEVFTGGKKYSKRSADYYDRYRFEASKNNSISFDFPKDWHLDWEKDNFSGGSGSVQIQGKVWNAKTSLEQAFKGSLPDNTIKHIGQEMSENLGGSFWTEKAFVSEKEGTLFQHVLCQTTKGDRSYLISISIPEYSGESAHSVLLNLLQTFSWEDVPVN